MRVCMRVFPTITSIALSVILGYTQSVRGEEAGERVRARPTRTELLSPVVEARLDLGSGQPVVEVTINGKGSFKLVLDTGAKATKLDDDVVKSLGLRLVRKTEIHEAPGATPTVFEVVGIDSLTLGGAVFRDFEATVLDYDEIFGGKRRYDGVLGYPVFADCLLTLDYPREHVVLKQGELPAADGREILSYEERDGLAGIPVVISRIPVKIIVDSGMAGAIALAERLEDGVTLALQPAKRSDIASQLNIREARLSGTLRLGRHRLIEPPVYFFGTGSAVGHKVLRNFVVTLDQKNGRVRLARQGSDPIIFGLKPKFGLTIGRRRGGLVITYIVPGSRADEILRVGDGVLSIEGRRASEFDEHSLATLFAESDVIAMQIDRGGRTLLLTLKAEP
ncbi:MAG: aspartyl protease family protein [Phycisphaerales bacterium]|nr:MAG: aspartyl protease family protein [Phycisphaerales bacterium]